MSPEARASESISEQESRARVQAELANAGDDNDAGEVVANFCLGLESHVEETLAHLADVLADGEVRLGAREREMLQVTCAVIVALADVLAGPAVEAAAVEAVKARLSKLTGAAIREPSTNAAGGSA